MQFLTPMAIDFMKTNAHIFYRSESFLIPLNLMTSIRNTNKKTDLMDDFILFCIENTKVWTISVHFIKLY